MLARTYGHLKVGGAAAVLGDAGEGEGHQNVLHHDQPVSQSVVSIK